MITITRTAARKKRRTARGNPDLPGGPGLAPLAWVQLLANRGHDLLLVGKAEERLLDDLLAVDADRELSRLAHQQLGLDP
jgi:hypothetical protein